MKGITGENNPFFGKKHTEESKRKVSLSKGGDGNVNRKDYTIRIIENDDRTIIKQRLKPAKSKCTKCGRNKYGKSDWCKKCIDEEKQDLFEKGLKKCTKCKEIRTLDKFYKHNKSIDGLEPRCIICSEEYREDNRETIRDRGRKYAKNKREQIRGYQKEYYKRNPHAMVWRKILKRTLKYFDKKKEGKTIDLLKYPAIDLKTHMIGLFTPEMFWDKNYGHYGKKIWNIDHIIGINNFKSDTHHTLLMN